MTEEEIAQFQAKFLDWLDSTSDLDALDESLPQMGNEALNDYVEECDRTMLKLAAVLVKQWGRRASAADG